jgi:hypothetical protein
MSTAAKIGAGLILIAFGLWLGFTLAERAAERMGL